MNEYNLRRTLFEVNAMKALKLQATVDKHRRIVIDVPPEIAEGPVELILLARDSVEDPRTLAEHLDRVAVLPGRRSRAEIDAALEAERGAWD